jgi:hypothetical protein
MMLPMDALLLGLIHLFSSASPTLVILSGLPDFFGGIVVLVIGLLIIGLLIAAAIVLLPAIIVAAVVWFLTGSFFLAGIAFLVVAVIWLIAISGD